MAISLVKNTVPFAGKARSLMQVLDEKENYLLVTDGSRFTVAEHRAGKLYPVRNCSRRGVAADDAGVAELMKQGGSFTEPQARHLLSEVATQWRDLFEVIR